MKEAVYKSHTSSAVRVCIDKISGDNISGRLYCPKEEVVVFEDLGLMLIALEQALDRRGFPYACQKKRSFFTAPDHEGAKTYYKKLKMALASRDTVDGPVPFGECHTFLLYVLSRRDCSWQGKIEWLDDGTLDDFDSDLMLLNKICQRISQ